MSKLGKFAAASAVVLGAFGAGMAHAADYYVATTGAEENPGTAEAPFATIAAAIGAAHEGDTIHVASGDYNEWGLKIEKALRIVGEGEAREDVCVYGYEAQPTEQGAYQTGRRIVYMTADATIANMTIKNGGFTTDGKDANGGNVFMDAGTITNCVIQGGYVNHTTDAGIKGALGGNLYMRGGLVVDCEIKDGRIYNQNGAGGGGNVVMYGGGARLMRCKVTGARRTVGNNPASFTDQSGGSGIYMNGDTTAENCLVTDNAGSYGAVSMIGAAKLVNCTVAGNHDNYGGRNGLYLRDANPFILNSVIVDNGGTAASEWGGTRGSCFSFCASTAEIVDGTYCVLIKNDLASDFVDTVSYRPTIAAEFVDNASYSQYTMYAQSGRDVGGSPRSCGELDMGAWEFNSGSVSVLDSVLLMGRETVFSVSLFEEDATYVWDFGDGTTRTADGTETRYAYPTAGVFAVSLTISRPGKPDEVVEAVKPVRVYPATLYVDAANANPVAPYDEPGKACQSVAEAIDSIRDVHGDLAIPGVTVRIATGTYTEANIFLDKKITILGCGATPGDVILQAQATPRASFGLRVFYLTGDVLISGLTIQNGCFDTPGTDENGGNVFMKAGTITNCVIRGGHVKHSRDASIPGALGGNVYMRGGLIVDSVICDGSIENVSGAGGGGNVMMYGGGSRLVRCRVTGARRIGGAGTASYTEASGGSGIYMNGDATAENCLVADNAGSCGAVSMAGASRLVNCTVAGNHDNYQGRNGLYVRDALPLVINTIAFGAATDASSWGGLNGGCFKNCAVSGTEISGGTSCLALSGQASSYFEDLTDFRPLKSSVVLEAGSQELYELYARSATDLDGCERLVDTIDIGCYETVVEGFGCSGSVSKQSARRLEPLTFGADSVGADDVTYTWDFGDGATMVTKDKTVSYAFPTCGVFTAVLTVDGGEKGCGTFELQPITVVTEVLYVNAANATPEAPYDRPEKAAQTLKTAALAVKDATGKMLADEIVVHVAAGTYTESGVTFDRSVRIFGEGTDRGDVVFQATELPIQGQGRVLSLYGGGEVRNLTIRNGDHTTGSSDLNGGNLYVKDGLVSNCVLTAGHVRHTGDGVYSGMLGGNLYLCNAMAVDCLVSSGSVENVNGAGGGVNVAMTGSSQLLRCQVTGGYRTGPSVTRVADLSGGSGVYANGSSLIENCLVADNAGSYGAVVLKNGAVVRNCTIAGNHDNHADLNGIILQGNCSAINCALYNSTTNTVGEWGGANGAKFENCAASMEIVGGSNCIVLPQSVSATFRDTTSYCPSASSLLRDAGTCYLGLDKSLYGVDLRRRHRFVGKAPDIGCYESSGGLMLSVR